MVSVLRLCLSIFALHCCADARLVREFYTQGPQKLSFFHFYTSVQLFHFQLPQDTTLALWSLVAFKERGSGLGEACPDHPISVYLRPGAPPVINPLQTDFPPHTLVPGVISLRLDWNSPNKTNSSFNVSNPLPGDWFLAAHLPEEDGKISVKGLTAECRYLFQPQLIVEKRTGLQILYPGRTLQQYIGSHNDTCLSKVFVPEYSSHLSVDITNCNVSDFPLATGCLLKLQLRPKAPPLLNSTTAECNSSASCRLDVNPPMWGVWYYVSVESLLPNVSVRYDITVIITDCFNAQVPASSSLFMSNSSVNPELCVPFRPTLRNDLDTLSTQFYIFFGPNVTVRAKVPTILALTLIPHMDSGAVFTFEMQLNVSSTLGENVTVVACLHPDVPFVPSNNPPFCGYGSQGNQMVVRAGSESIQLLMPYPRPGHWYLALRVICSNEDWQLTDCSNYSAQVLLHAYLSPCIADCGIYGECRLMRSYSYVLAACRCRAGWNGWGCTDGTKALSYAQQLLRTMLLTLSNLMFVPPIVIALRSCLYMESAVYAFNMFFSTFYHACDQPGVAVLCIMDYDVLQYCDFFGSLMSVWVTLIAMARLKNTTKEIMYLLGALVLAMVVQLDRWGLWNLLGPCLFALILLVISWGMRMSRRHSCYPPSWRRWVFFLLPGCSIAITAVLLYALVETTANYYYTHALWHILIAGSVSFLLPPHDARSINIHGAAGRKRCGYQLCIEEPEGDEPQTMESVLVSVNSVCPV